MKYLIIGSALIAVVSISFAQEKSTDESLNRVRVSGGVGTLIDVTSSWSYDYNVDVAADFGIAKNVALTGGIGYLRLSYGKGMLKTLEEDLYPQRKLYVVTAGVLVYFEPLIAKLPYYFSATVGYCFGEQDSIATKNTFFVDPHITPHQSVTSQFIKILYGIHLPFGKHLTLVGEGGGSLFFVQSDQKILYLNVSLGVAYKF